MRTLLILAVAALSLGGCVKSEPLRSTASLTVVEDANGLPALFVRTWWHLTEHL